MVKLLDRARTVKPRPDEISAWFAAGFILPAGAGIGSVLQHDRNPFARETGIPGRDQGRRHFKKAGNFILDKRGTPAHTCL